MESCKVTDHNFDGLHQITNNALAVGLMWNSAAKNDVLLFIKRRRSVEWESIDIPSKYVSSHSILLFLSIHAESGKQVNDNRRVHPVDLVCEDHWRAIPLVSNVGMITTVVLFSYPSKTSSAGVRKMTSFAY